MWFIYGKCQRLARFFESLGDKLILKMFRVLGLGTVPSFAPGMFRLVVLEYGSLIGGTGYSLSLISFSRKGTNQVLSKASKLGQE